VPAQKKVAVTYSKSSSSPHYSEGLLYNYSVRRLFKSVDDNYLRTVVFGFEDALVSTTGAIIGISVGTSEKNLILLAGLVTLTVEAVSMGAGQYISEKAAHEAAPPGEHKDNLIVGAWLMFFAYAIAGMVPLFPLFFFSGPKFIFSCLISALIGLFVLGYVKGQVVGKSAIRSALQILIIGGFATIIGAVVGFLFRVK
jgi:vacuolar iron transporter family protein